MTGLATVVHCLRLFCRISTKQLGIGNVAIPFISQDFALTLTDDHLMSAAVVAFIGFTDQELNNHLNGAYRNLDDIEETETLSRVNYVLYSPILCLIKASVLWFLLRIGGHNTRIKWTIYILNAINALFMMATIAISLSRHALRSYRFDFVHFELISAAITLIVDVMVLAIPIWMFAGLNMRWVLRLSLILMFLVSGLVIIIMDAMRITTHISGLAVPTSKAGLEFLLRFWGATVDLTEITLGIICACIPTVRPLFVACLPRSTSHDASERIPYCTRIATAKQRITIAPYPTLDCFWKTCAH
ncbi:hypothetical protein PG984_001669 [Apiospora sp. TS-2023a]